MLSEENIVVIDNGDTIELTADSISKGDKVPSGIQLVDTAGVVHENVMEERQQLAEDGVITISANVDKNGNLESEPQINLRGVVCSMDSTSLERLINRTVDRTIGDRIKSNLLLNDGGNINWGSIRIEVETAINRVIQRELQSSPLVIFMLHVQEGKAKASEPSNGKKSVTKTNGTKSEKTDVDPKFTRRRRKTTTA